MINRNSKIFLAGHRGHLGSSILDKLIKRGYKNIIIKNKNSLDLLNQSKAFNFLNKKKPDVVIIAAARVGGIYANNKFRGKFIYENSQNINY